MIINDLDGYYIVFDTKNWNTELDTLVICSIYEIRILPDERFIFRRNLRVTGFASPWKANLSL